jgi:hypothetical protein
MLTERLAEWWADRWVKKNLSKLNSKGITDADLSRLEDPKNGVIILRADGFAVEAPAFTADLTFNEVCKIFSYKKDLVTTDLICMGFGTGKNQLIVETHEEMAGFLKLRREVERRIPGISEAFNRWLLNSPAFDTTAVCIWESPTATKGSDYNNAS